MVEPVTLRIWSNFFQFNWFVVSKLIYSIFLILLIGSWRSILTDEFQPSLTTPMEILQCLKAGPFWSIWQRNITSSIPKTQRRDQKYFNGMLLNQPLFKHNKLGWRELISFRSLAFFPLFLQLELIHIGFLYSYLWNISSIHSIYTISGSCSKWVELVLCKDKPMCSLGKWITIIALELSPTE